MERLRALRLAAWRHRHAVIVAITPLVLSATILIPVDLAPELTTKAKNCLFVLLLVACYWITEAVDLAVAALLPLVLFPLMGVMSAESVARQYVKSMSFMVMGSFLIAAAVDKSGIQRRIALNTLRLVGGGKRTLLLVVMALTWFISMWMCNAATTAAMMTVVRSLLSEMNALAEASDGPVEPNSQQTIMTASDQLEKSSAEAETVELQPCVFNVAVARARKYSREDQHVGEINSELLSLSKALSLGVAYSATIGGMATLIGNASNVVIVQSLETLAKSYSNITTVTFSTWLVIGMPLSTMLLIFSWLWLQLLFFGFRNVSSSHQETLALKSFLKDQCMRLGKVSFKEILVGIHFVLLVLLWMTRDMGDAGGWGRLFSDGFVNDGTTAMAVGLLLFVIPASLTLSSCRQNETEKEERQAVEKEERTVLTWKYAQQRIPWGILILLGGGFALAEGVATSGLSAAIGKFLSQLVSGLPEWGTIMVVSAVAAALTEVASNVAVSALLLPIVGRMAIALGKNPLYLMLPTCLASSYAFMLPGAAPPNALVFSTSALKVADMVKAGFVMNVMGLLAITMAVTTWVSTYFNLTHWSGVELITIANVSTPGINSTLYH